MRRFLVKACAALLCACMLFLAVGCASHQCRFIEKSTEAQYRKSEATCLSPAEYYYSCSCGAKGEEVFTDGDLGDHRYTQKVAEERFFKSAATKESPALYYLSCVCGLAGTETFKHGGILLTAEEKKLYQPTSLTVTLYDSQELVYGFTYNTTKQPLDPVIQVKKNGEEAWSEYPLSSERSSSYNKDETRLTYYVTKGTVALEANTTYIYRIYDKDADVGSEEATLTTKNPKADAFTFVHVSDSQDGPDYFKFALSSVVDRADFLLHTGDVVESSKYEQEWTTMLDGSFEYLSQIPMMAISGNHETTYKSGAYETYKHFHNKMPEQDTRAGYYYSFIYGNVKFIMLNTNVLANNRLLDAQYEWLENELKTNTCKWTVVALHNPLYSVGKYGANPDRNQIALALQTQLRGLFAQYGVDIVLQGHDHAISRTFPIDADGVPQKETVETIDGVAYSVDPSGVIYVMNGPAGSQTREPYSIDETLYAYAERSRPASWAEFSFDDDTLTVTVKYRVGKTPGVYQTWGIKKTA